MIVYCEECGYKNTIDEDRLHGQHPRIPCEKCGDLLRFYGLKAKVLQKPPVQDPACDPHTRLVLKYGKVAVVVDEKNSRVEIGRQKSNAIQVMNNRVSRTHALIEYREGRYYLTDQSSNGTYLLMEQSKGIALRKKEILLTASGVIGPGYKVDLNSPEAIHFRLEKSG